MARYFNRTRGPATVSLKTGESALVAPKAVLDVTPAQDGSASIHAMVRKRILVKLKEPTPVEKKATEVSKAAPSEPERAVVSKDVVEDVQEEEPVQKEVPSLQWTKKRLIAHAESQGVELPDNPTKIRVLQAIKGLDDGDH